MGDHFAGRNVLGHCLMWLRSQIREVESIEDVLTAHVNEYPYLKNLTLCGKSFI